MIIVALCPERKILLLYDTRVLKNIYKKRLALCNLKELYSSFKEKYPEIKVRFSKFAELRPPHCVLAGANGTQSVSVCMIHQNIKLMIDGAKIQKLTQEDAYPIQSYHQCIARLMCNPPKEKCYLNECTECPSSNNLKDHSEVYLKVKE